MKRDQKMKFERALHTYITKERITELDSMGFSWNPREESWEAMRKELADYRSHFGDCKVPNKWLDNKELGNWVKVQRTEKRKFDQGLCASTRITKERITALDSMGFSWNPTKESWEAMRKQLADYESHFGDCNVPTNWPDNKGLATWVRRSVVRR